MDPTGELFRHERHQAEADLDTLDAIVAGRAGIRHEVAKARREWVASDAARLEEEPDGGFVPFSHALTNAIERPLNASSLASRDKMRTARKPFVNLLILSKELETPTAV
ncbi:MAG: hypothetical protein ACRYG8_30320 [Janthinobacterium lividum]